jgi:hypothetical protein
MWLGLWRWASLQIGCELTNHAAYLQSWIWVLRESPKVLLQVVSEARQPLRASRSPPGGQCSQLRGQAGQPMPRSRELGLQQLALAAAARRRGETAEAEGPFAGRPWAAGSGQQQPAQIPCLRKARSAWG